MRKSLFPETTEQLPLHDSMFVIFGITGDLAKRKLLPALYHLVDSSHITHNFHIIGVTRRNTTVDEIITVTKQSLESSGHQPNKKILTQFKSMIKMVDMDICKADDYEILKEAINKTTPPLGTPLNRLFYLAVPPEMYTTISDGLGKVGLNMNRDTQAETRLLIEKPFGYDTTSAQSLMGKLEKYFSESSIYRVDHYLAKETSQNLLTFRFKNPLFNAVWDKSTVSYIMITAAETIGIEGRINFYEQTGALRDLIQSHLLQLCALITMEKPKDLTSHAIHESKLKLLNAIKTIEPEQVTNFAVRGQYDGYRQEVGNPNSTTETYAAVRLDIDNDRWRGVPILLRSGKSMAQKITEITLIFEGDKKTPDERNALTIRIQPDEGIVLSLLAKKPSLDDETEMVQMEFCYDKSFGVGKKPDAYEHVLSDAIRGEKTLFTTDDEVLESWRIFENVIKEWGNGGDVAEYPRGSWGPTAADDMAARTGANWLTGHLHLCPVKK